MSSRLIPALALFLVSTVACCALAAEYDNYFVGIDFLTETYDPIDAFGSNWEPYPIVQPGNNFVFQGGVGTLSESEMQRRVIMSIEDVFRRVDTGDPSTTARLAIYEGPVPTDLDGRRLNMAMGESANPNFGLLGQAKQDAFTVNFPQDGYASVTFLDSIDGMGDGGAFVVYDTLAEVLNGIAGTSAHEIGHMLGAVHVPTILGTVPQFLMSTESLGLPTSDRFTERRFSTTEPDPTSNAEIILGNLGTVTWGDFNFDNTLDAADAGIMFASWGRTDRLFQEGDANNDHLIDAVDAGLLFENWNGDSVAFQPVPEPADACSCVLGLAVGLCMHRIGRMGGARLKS